MDNEIRIYNEELVQFSEGGSSPHTIGQITGYAARYYDPSNPGTEYNVVNDVWFRIQPGAFDQLLAKKPDVKFFYGHNTGMIPLGRTTSGTGRIWADEKGLAYSLDIPNSSEGNNLKIALDRRDVTGSSFSALLGFGNWKKEGEKQVKTLVRFSKLIEISPVADPAFTATDGLVYHAKDYQSWMATQVRLEIAKKLIAKH